MAEGKDNAKHDQPAIKQTSGRQYADRADQCRRACRNAISGAASGNAHDHRFGKTERLGVKPGFFPIK